MNVENLKRLLSQNGPAGLAVDIDDTLSVTGPSWYQALINIGGHPGLTYLEIVKQYGMFHLVPGWKDNPGTVAWMERAQYDPEGYTRLLPVEDAQSMLTALAEIMPLQAYVTMRPISVLDATRAWLQQHGFPELPILSRPADVSHERMHGWKGRALHTLWPRVCGIIDDDPRLIRQLPDDYPGTFYLFGEREHEPRPGIRVVPCKTWRQVYQLFLSQTAI